MGGTESIQCEMSDYNPYMYIITFPMTEVFVGTDNATATKVLCESFHSFSSLGY